MSDTQSSATTNRCEAILEAVEEVRQEARKAVALHATVDGLLVFIVGSLAVYLTGSGTRGGTIQIGLPEGFASAGEAVGLYIPGSLTVSGIDVLVLGGTLIVAFVDAVVRYRRFDVTQLEAYNPELEVAFRTARDAASDAKDSPVAGHLYAEVLEGLERASTREFVRWRQMYAAFGVVLLLALVGAGVVSLGLEVGDGGGDTTPTIDTDGQDFVGEEAPVDRGSESREIVLGQTGDTADVTGEYDASDFSIDAASLQAAQASFTDETRPENADLVRDYYEQLRGDTTEDP